MKKEEKLYSEKRKKVLEIGKCSHNLSLPICETSIDWKFKKNSKDEIVITGKCIFCKRLFYQ